MKSILDKINNDDELPDLLPFFHITRARNLFSIFESQNFLKFNLNENQKSFEKDKLFFHYGQPRYRYNVKEQSGYNSRVYLEDKFLQPVCLQFNLESISDNGVRFIFCPTDSGFMGEVTDLNDLLLSSLEKLQIEDSDYRSLAKYFQKYIKLVFLNNQNYIKGYIPETLQEEFFDSDQIAEFFKILRSSLKGDIRMRTCELIIQMRNDGINGINIQAVFSYIFLPANCLQGSKDQKNIRNLLENRDELRIINYNYEMNENEHLDPSRIFDYLQIAVNEKNLFNIN